MLGEHVWMRDKKNSEGKSYMNDAMPWDRFKFSFAVLAHQQNPACNMQYAVWLLNVAVDHLFLFQYIFQNLLKIQNIWMFIKLLICMKIEIDVIPHMSFLYLLDL